MTDRSNKKLQVFVSSTYTDLKAERQAAVEAILTAGHMPAGMELFTAGDESQWEVIKQWIDESDIYMLILGGRYGSVEPTSKKSYTQLEYEYAVSKGKALFACVTNEVSLKQRALDRKDVDIIETDYAKELRDFRQEVKTRMVRFWDDLKDIKIYVSESLATLARRPELIGWVRADQVLDANVTNEIARLSHQNALLVNQVRELSKTEPLSEFAKELMLFCNVHGTFQFDPRDAELKAGDVLFHQPDEGGARGVAKWRYAVNELEKCGLIESTRQEGSWNYFALTHAGFAMSDAMAEQG